MQAIDTATGADSTIAFQNLLADVPRVAAQAKFVHAPRGAKRRAAFGNLQVAPTAEITTVRSLGKSLWIDPTARHDPLGTHLEIVSFKKYQKRNRIATKRI
jgi:hypothetical protein